MRIMASMNHIAPPPSSVPPESGLMCIKEVARLLHCCPRTVNRYVRDGVFPPPIRIGKHGTSVRWVRSVVLAWIAEREAEAVRKAGFRVDDDEDEKKG